MPYANFVSSLCRNSLKKSTLSKTDSSDYSRIEVPKKRKLLIITSSGGGGLIQTANAKEQEALAKDPDLLVVRCDLLKDWVPFGSFCVHFWNGAQRRGSVFAQMICIYGQRLVDFFLSPTLFFQALRTFVREDVDQVMDTQCLGTAAIIRALRVFNWKKKKKAKIEKILVDLPTKKATHFFRPIKKLSKKNRHLLQLTSIAPLLDEGETAEEFWQNMCGLSEKDIKFEEVYVRRAFLQYKRKNRTDEAMTIKIRYKNQEELQLIRQALGQVEIRPKKDESALEFHLESEERVFTILLGSQPAKGATLNYVKKISQIAQENRHVKTRIFVFCADHEEGRGESLFQQVADFALHLKQSAENLSIIPFSFQKEDIIAPLFFRSDVTCTRSGGQTAMELMCVSTGEIWIHSEAKPGQDVLRGIPGWEAASALYLKRLHGAKIVTPDSCLAPARALYQTDTRQVLANRPLESTA